MNPKTHIRNYIARGLREKLPAHVKIFSSRRLPLLVSEFPCVLIYTDHEASEVFNETPAIYKKTLNLVIEVLMSHPEELDSKIDEICFCVDAYLVRLDTFEAQIHRVIPKSTSIETSVQGENLVGVAKLNFEITYLSRVVQTDYHLPTLEQTLPILGAIV